MGNGLRVLLVDDSALTLSLVAEVLTGAGFEVRSAATRDDLQALLSEWTPEVVLTDVMMPDMNGPEICRWFKGRIESVFVILMSNLPSETLEEIARNHGADGFVSKECGIHRLPRQVEEICEGVVW